MESMQMNSANESQWKKVAEIKDAQLPVEPWECAYGSFVQAPDGIKAEKETYLQLTMTHERPREIRARLRISGTDGHPVWAKFFEYKFIVGGSNDPASRMTLGMNALAATGKRCIKPDQEVEVLFEITNDIVQTQLDGEVLMEVKNSYQGQAVPDFAMIVPEGAIVKELTVEGRDIDSSFQNNPIHRSNDYDLYIAIDIYDDLIINCWTKETYRQAMQTYRKNKIKRVYFVYHYGYESGFWEQPGGEVLWPGFQQKIDDTYNDAGDFMQASIEAAHAEGLELFAIFKPYETAFPVTFPLGSEEARRYGKIPSLGGDIWWSPSFTAENPHLRIERNMSGIPDDLDQRVVRTIVLKAEPGTSPSLNPDRLRLWVSADNGRYNPYTGPVKISVENGVEPRIVFDELDIRENFFAFTVEGGPTNSFGNTLRNLIEIRDTDGTVLPVTFSTQVNTYCKGKGFQETGFMMDCSAAPDGTEYNYVDGCFFIDGQWTLGIGLGREQYMTGSLCAAYDKVQTWWMQQVENCLKAGVDGIDFRIANHNPAMDGGLVGFSEPIVEEFKKRYGVDILHEPFDLEAWRRLRGEYYTDFLRRASARVRQAGKIVQAHVNTYMLEPKVQTYLPYIHFNWQTWIDERLLDELTMKRWRLDAMRGGIAPTVISYAKKAGLPVMYSPFMNTLRGDANGPEVLRFHVREALEGGADSFIIYESAGLAVADADGNFVVNHPWMMEAVVEHARG